MCNHSLADMSHLPNMHGQAKSEPTKFVVDVLAPIGFLLCTGVAKIVLASQIETEENGLAKFLASLLWAIKQTRPKAGKY